MNILLTGATGFIGRALALRLLRDGHAVTALVRDEAKARDQLGADVRLRPYGDAASLRSAVEGSDAIVNLAGAPIFPGRWTEGRKRALMESRAGLTRGLVDAVASAERRPKALVSASAVGYYGFNREEPTEETAPRARDFLGELCGRWEEETARAAEFGLREARVRIGLVLGAEGGMLAPLLPLFKAGLGGRIGSGAMWMPWIHLDDVVEVFARAVADDRYAGPVNASAPSPVTNAEFTKALGRALGRPTPLPVPPFALRAAFGEAAGLLLGGVRMTPKRLEALEFPFAFRDVDAALADVLDVSGVAIEPAGDLPESAYLREQRPTHVLKTRALIDAPVEEVFDFFSKADNLGAITPSWMGFSIATPRPIAMGKGATIDYTIRLGPVPMTWRTVIERWEPGALFVDSQRKGPYRCWRHEHHFRAEGGRTIMDDRVYYAPPLGPIGGLANAAYVASTLKRIFAYREKAIRLRFGLSGRG